MSSERPTPPEAIASTATPLGARAHARAQGSSTVATMPIVPASRVAEPPEGVGRERLVWVERVAAGGYATRLVRRGTRLRLSDPDGGACAHVALFVAPQPFERLCVADTVKVGWNAYLGEGSLLLSDQGRVLASIVADTSGRHDTMAGVSTLSQNLSRYGAGSAESSSPSGRELLLLGAAKHGLERRDLPATVSFFQGVSVEADGSLRFVGSAGRGAIVELLAELPLVVVLANTAHPLDPRDAFTCSDLEVVAWRDRPTAPGDDRWSATPEGERAFLNSAELLDGLDGLS